MVKIPQPRPAPGQGGKENRTELMTKPTLLVLAAGMGNRYGGLKQIDPIGPGRETLFDYAVFDALRAGFGKLVFVIRHRIEAAFRKRIGHRFEERIPVEYAYQELDGLPRGFRVPPHRERPWGTGHAILCAAPVIHEPFAVVNADDFYGPHSFQALVNHLRSARDADMADYCMVGFVLRQTLSDFGTVARGICRVSADGCLETVVERTAIERNGDGARFLDADRRAHHLTGDETVSMNLWGFTPSIFEHLERLFVLFLKESGSEPKAEFYIPTVVDTLVASRVARVKVLHTNDRWFGMTYHEDKATAEASVRQWIADGVYPEDLWRNHA